MNNYTNFGMVKSIPCCWLPKNSHRWRKIVYILPKSAFDSPLEPKNTVDTYSSGFHLPEIGVLTNISFFRAQCLF